MGLPSENAADDEPENVLQRDAPAFLSEAGRVSGLGGYRCVNVSCGAEFTCVITDTNALFTWGDNQFGQLGQGDAITRGTPTQV